EHYHSYRFNTYILDILYFDYYFFYKVCDQNKCKETKGSIRSSPQKKKSKKFKKQQYKQEQEQEQQSFERKNN
ncbi:MAG: hypothetical protein MUC49_20480, partial [Raineya sp.]|nr:hypothetical protein [Raineya sp.]